MILLSQVLVFGFVILNCENVEIFKRLIDLCIVLYLVVMCLNVLDCLSVGVFLKFLGVK